MVVGPTSFSFHSCLLLYSRGPVTLSSVLSDRLPLCALIPILALCAAHEAMEELSLRMVHGEASAHQAPGSPSQWLHDAASAQLSWAVAAAATATATASSTTKLAPLAPAQSRCMETTIYMGVSIYIPAAGADMLSP